MEQKIHIFAPLQTGESKDGALRWKNHETSKREGAMARNKNIVRDILIYLPVLTLDSHETVEKALRLMAWNKRSAVGVTKNDIFAGIFTRSDFLDCLIDRGKNPQPTHLADVLTPNPFTISSDYTLQSAFSIMCKKRVRHLPVIDDGKFLGIISDDDLRLEIANDLHQVKEDHNFLLSYMGNAYSSSSAQ